jgi:hypothetical protein
MTRNQLALSVGADEKWVENTTYLLGLSTDYTAARVIWLGLVRVFNHDLGLPLTRAAALATEALQHDPSIRHLKLGSSDTSDASFVLDLARCHSTCNTMRSAALVLGVALKRGRPAKKASRDALRRAKDYGIDVDALRTGLSDSVATRLERLEQNVQFVHAMRQLRPLASKRGTAAKRKLKR